MAINSWDKLTNDEKLDRLTNVLTRAGSETMNLIKRLFLNSCERGTARKTRSFLILSLSTLMMLASTQMISAKEEYFGFDDFNNEAAVIYAHQDDDLIWMLPWWAKSTHIVIGGLPTTPGYMGLIANQQVILDQHVPRIDYQGIWEHPFGEITDCQYYSYYWDNHTVPFDPSGYVVAFWDDKDVTVTRAQVDLIKDHIRDYVRREDVTRIVTHNNWGEYGHQHHRAVNQASRELAVEYGKDVWVLGSKLFGATFYDLNVCDVPYTFGLFEGSLFHDIRTIYYATNICLRDAWTGGDFDPTGSHKFIKVVDHGNDLSASSQCIRKAYNAVMGPIYIVGDNFGGDGQVPDFVGTYPDSSIWDRTCHSGNCPWSEVPGQLDMIVTGHFNTEDDGRTHLAGINQLEGSIWYTTDLTNPTSVTWTQVEGYLTTIVAGDFDGDGVTDIAGIDGPNHTAWYTTKPSDPNAWHEIPGTLDSLVVGDFDGDGKADLAGINNATHRVYYVTGMATGMPTIHLLDGEFNSIVAGKLDGNSRFDLAALDKKHHVFYMLDPSATSHWIQITPQQQFFSLVVGNFGHHLDGHDDLGALSFEIAVPNTDIRYILITTDLTTWTTLPNAGLSTMFSGDYNHDGTGDLAGVNHLGNTLYYTTDVGATWHRIDDD